MFKAIAAEDKTLCHNCRTLIDFVRTLRFYIKYLCLEDIINGPFTFSCRVIGTFNYCCRVIGTFNYSCRVIGTFNYSCRVIGTFNYSCRVIGTFM